jgi:uncharacterized membrane protein
MQQLQKHTPLQRQLLLRWWLLLLLLLHMIYAFLQPRQLDCWQAPEHHAAALLMLPLLPGLVAASR